MQQSLPNCDYSLYGRYVGGGKGKWQMCWSEEASGTKQEKIRSLKAEEKEKSDSTAKQRTDVAKKSETISRRYLSEVEKI